MAETSYQKVPMVSLNGRHHEDSEHVGGSDGGRQEEEVRQQWSRKSEYILSLIGFSVGLGNIWRFPYICMKNGGGAFLIPFFISVVLCALPVFVMESAMGQFLGKSVWHAWSICPLFQGVGVSMNLLCLFVSWYYIMILAWCAIYFVNSFKSPQPWTLCGQPWNTPACVSSTEYSQQDSALGNITREYANVAVMATNETFPLFRLNASLVTYNDTFGNDSINSNITSTPGLGSGVSSSKEFWLYNVLELSSGLDEMGGFPWHTVVALIAVNFLVFLSIVNGVRSSGKVVYVTATLPYLLLTILIIAGCLQPGALDGILFYVRPDFSKLIEVNTWTEAFIQVFYSLGIGLGSMITMASYNKFHNNCVRDSVLLGLCCEGTSVFGGFATFSVLGHLAYVSNVPIENFAKSGAGLAFIVYPEAISYLPLPQLWGVLFFLMLISLGLDSQFVNIETLLTTLVDLFPQCAVRRKSVTAVTMTVMGLIALIFATRGGMYLFQLLDWYYAAFSYLIQAALECIIVGWIYGANRFSQDIEMMIGYKISFIFILCWKFITPAILMTMFFVTLVTYQPPVYEGYHYSDTAVAFGWLFAVFPFLTVIVWLVLDVLRRPGSLSQRLRSSCIPSKRWTPNRPSKLTYGQLV